MNNQNKVLTDNYRKSLNFYKSDRILSHFVSKYFTGEMIESLDGRLNWIGETAAQEMDTLSLKADKMPPQLNKRDAWGEDIDEIEFHPSYWRLVEIAAKSGMFSVKWEPSQQKQYAGHLNKTSFAISSIYAMSETGVYCPLCMTDGVAVLINKYCSQKDKDRLLPSIYSEALEDLKTGAMYLTEKAGGSDVGANLVTAKHWKDDLYLLNGEKWFCSNANGQITFVLARTNPEKKGTRGLSIFLVEKELEDGTKNPMNIIRLKDKLGVKSMASAEIILTDTVGKLVGEEYQGFKVMTDMINLSRVYNSIAALSASRRALIEAYQFLKGRFTFGKNALQHPLIRTKLEELGANQIANFYIVWRAIEALDKPDDTNEASLLRLLTPMIKKWSAENGVYITRESMELMGGIGYIEDQVMPKLMRDIMVLPIWEGAGNIMTLDMLRASIKSEGLTIMMKEIAGNVVGSEYEATILKELKHLQTFAEKLMQQSEELIQSNAAPFFSKLTQTYQASLLAKNLDEESKTWLEPALNFFMKENRQDDLMMTTPLSETEVDQLIAWEV